jgi:plasmid maintenance system antidote protein VapI
MTVRKSASPITAVLRRAIVENGISHKALARETGVARASIMRFVRGDQSIRLDMADRLAVFFGLSLVKYAIPSTKKDGEA